MKYAMIFPACCVGLRYFCIFHKLIMVKGYGFNSAFPEIFGNSWDSQWYKHLFVAMRSSQFLNL